MRDKRRGGLKEEDIEVRERGEREGEIKKERERERGEGTERGEKGERHTQYDHLRFIAFFVSPVGL